jgi:hypothetical protein
VPTKANAKGNEAEIANRNMEGKKAGKIKEITDELIK